VLLVNSLQPAFLAAGAKLQDEPKRLGPGLAAGNGLHPGVGDAGLGGAGAAVRGPGEPAVRTGLDGIGLGADAAVPVPARLDVLRR
jgi:hypothetical protein